MVSMLERYRKIKAGMAATASVEPVVKETPVVSSVVDSVVNSPACMTVKEALAVFGYTSFRKGQEEVLQAVLDGKDGVLAVFPTGYGKSIIFQIPSLITGKLTIVVSPLISLMRDQVSRLQSLGINAVFINSTVPMSDVKMALLEVQTGGVKALYVAPERFSNDEFMKAISGIQVDVFAVDESHCISKFGHDFRPSYAELGGVIEKINPRQVVALTATATPKVQDDICKMLGIEKAKRFISGVHRSNLKLLMFDGYGNQKLSEMSKLVKKFVTEGKKTGIVYSPTRKESDEICDYFKRSGIPSTLYHAGLKDSERASVQDTWAKDGGVIVATCAFGMGIDRSDVRFVIHSGLSQSIEDFWQEVGRAGRDGQDSFCVTFWDFAIDYRTQMFLIDLTSPSAKDVDGFWTWIRQTALSQVVPGSKTAELNMTQKAMSDMSRCQNVGGCIAALKNEHLVTTLGRGKYEVCLSKDRVQGISPFELIRKDKIDKLNQVVSFYQSKDCRASYLCGYFGDITFDGACGGCDNCTR